jgi:hypothetical protein
MITKQLSFKNRDLKTATLAPLFEGSPQLGFIFSSTGTFQDQDFIQKLMKQNPSTQWVGCSTAGEVSAKGVTDETTILTTLKFENAKSRTKIAITKIKSADMSGAAGEEIGRTLAGPELKAVILIGPGVTVNGTSLVEGINKTVGQKILVTGGLAGDGGKFEKTFTLSPEGVFDDQVIGVGIYGDSLTMKHGCMGGWDPFGKVRKVTKSEQNVVFELDGKPALEVYKEYLGDHAKDLPGSGLMFPFSMMKDEKSESGLIRTILAVDDKKGSLTFAGDVPQGCHVRLMQANTKGLVGGAKTAAEGALTKTAGTQNSFAMIVSCVGRKLVMGANVDDEIEVIADIFGPKCTLAGFYSYGEISPFLSDVGCQLHNQTMTISHLTEV